MTNSDPDLLLTGPILIRSIAWPRFTLCVGIQIQYLNRKGISDITPSPDGAAPGWISGTKLTAGTEKEYEMMASMVYYGIKRRTSAIHFNLLSPITETTCGGGERYSCQFNQLGTVLAV